MNKPARCYILIGSMTEFFYCRTTTLDFISLGSVWAKCDS